MKRVFQKGRQYRPLSFVRLAFVQNSRSYAAAASSATRRDIANDEPSQTSVFAERHRGQIFCVSSLAANRLMGNT
jgi:hypothetical protein